ncbi:MAG TPA: spermidine/putrescine ABC transporter substrate-binding protein [Jatrophihabitantaceae bacterium]|jgi:spermidine/putrescine transport system substrate-binding protein|nr:spermidine/putrescine ABC transporter substrate-binding protein [Jatrophihabitantaceae bacterium]
MSEPRRRPRRAPPSRRQFLRLAGTAAVVPATSGLLAACVRAAGSRSVSGALTLAAPDHPVLWPISAGNDPIADNLTPERNATLRLYNYADYIAPAAIKAFEKKYARYNVNVTVSTFNDTDEAITKIRTGAVPYDIYFPSYDQISRLVAAELVRPLNHSYLTNIDKVWATFQNPWYDQRWRYTVPYTVYTTGIGWRTDKVSTDIASLANPYDALWDAKYRGETAVIDDWHTAMAMCLLRAGKNDINTASSADLQVISQQLSELQRTSQPKVTITMYNDLPAGQLGQCQMWSGDVINAQYYLPKHTPVSLLRYWFPPDGHGMVDNDLMVILRDGKNPVLAHLFVQFMLDTKNALTNFSFVGYQPPQRSLVPDTVVARGFVPKNLSTAVVQEEYFDVGYRLLELTVDNDAAWHRIWLAFKAGG